MPRRQRTASVNIDASDLPDLTPQQQEFVRLLLAGKTGADAYRGAYNTENMQPSTIIANASRLRADGKIEAWLAAGRVAHLGTAVLTRDMHMAELERLRELAMKAGNYGAAVAAEQTRGKVAGHHIERIQEVPADPVETLRELARLSPDAAQALAEAHGIPAAAIQPSQQTTH